MANYYNQARQQYDQSYNMKVGALKSQLANNQLALEQQKAGINANYDTQVGNQNIANVKAKNHFSNAMLGRGIANSSIAGTGLAEQDQINNRLIGQINAQRTGALNNIDQQKAQLANNMNAQLQQMQADRAEGIQSLARQLEDRAWDKDYKNKQLQMEREKMLAENNYRNQSLAMQRANAQASNALAREQLEFNRQKFNKAQEEKDRRNTPEAVLADLRSEAMDDPLRAGRYYSARYGSDPKYSYVVKEANEYAKNYKYYAKRWGLIK